VCGHLAWRRQLQLLSSLSVKEIWPTGPVDEPPSVSLIEGLRSRAVDGLAWHKTWHPRARFHRCTLRTRLRSTK